MSYTLVDHTADLGVEVEAGSLDELFAEAALGFVHCITDVATVRRRTGRSFTVRSESLESLLVDWLSELLFVFETTDTLFSGVEVTVGEAGDRWTLKASLSGEVFDASRHPLKVPIKAITYHQLSVRSSEDRWSARVIFDI